MAFEAFRQRLGSIIGGFDAAQAHRRLRGFRASRAHVNTLIAASGDTITARGRWLVRNNGYAANAVESFASNVVGDGIKPSSILADAAKKEELQALWLAWTDDADAEGLTDFYGLQRRAAREVFLSGEVFIRIRPRRAEDGLTVPLQLQMLPAEMLPLDLNRALPGAGLIRQGIEFDGIGRRVAYHFLRRHPGDLTEPGLAGETVRVPAADVIHVLDPVEAGQLRGVSRFAAAIVKLFTLDLYDDAELERKKIAAMFAMFITSPAPETPLEPTEEDLEVEPGQVVRLDPGEDVSTPATPDSGGTYEPFQYRTLLQIAAALGVPYGYLTGDTAKGNFSNTRISLIEFRRRISAWQHGVLVYQLCRAVWVRWMDTAVLSGALDLPGYDSQRRQSSGCSATTPCCGIKCEHANDGGARTAAVRSPRLKLTARRDRRMTARPRMMTLEIDEELHEFLTLMVSDAGPYQSVSAYVEGLIRLDRASQEAAAFTQLQAELAAGFSAPESTYHPSSAAEVIARNRI